MSSKNIETELKELRDKMRLLKQSNKFENESFKNAQKLLNRESDFVNNEKICINIKSKNEWGTKQLINDEEAFIVANCYRKSLELVKKHFKEKKKKHKSKHFGENLIYCWNGNISANYAAELSNTSSYVKELNNISHQSEKCNINQTTIECKVANSHVQGNACLNSQEKRNKTVEKVKDTNLSSAIFKHAIDKHSQNELEAQMKKTSLTDDVVLLKTVTHSRKKKGKSISSSKKFDKNETFNVSGKRKHYPNNNSKHEIAEYTQKDHGIEQKETDDLDIVYLNTLNISPIIAVKNNKQIKNSSERINSTNFIEENALQSNSDKNNPISSFHSKCDSFSSISVTKKISKDSQHDERLSPAVIDISSEEDEPETIIPVWDFTEEPVDFTVTALHINEYTTPFSKAKIQLLESKGFVINKGKWSKEETDLLKRNYEDFVHRFGINDARLLLGIGRQLCKHKYENRNVRKFLRAKHFLVRLGKDIHHRSLYHIYEKARCLFHPLRYKRQTGQNDISFLLQLQKKYGNKWELISKKFGRPPTYCVMLYRDSKKCYAKGKWSNEEKQRLIYAVKKFTKSSSILFENLKKGTWVQVSELVETRSSDQCYRQWNRTLKYRKNFFLINHS